MATDEFHELKEVVEEKKPLVYEAILHIEKLFDQQKIELIKKKANTNEVSIPVLAIAIEKEGDKEKGDIVIISYPSSEAYEKAKCQIAGSTKEIIERVYHAIKEATE